MFDNIELTEHNETCLFTDFCINGYDDFHINYIINWDTGECVAYEDTMDIYPNDHYIF